MINFGVREVANSKATTAPGWAYVPDLAPNSAVTALQPRKRARNASSGASLHETTARQDAKILRELAALDRENHRDVNIPVPIKGRDGAGRS
jgi:zinc finger HIT domain-containing protein 1